MEAAPAAYALPTRVILDGSQFFVIYLFIYLLYFWLRNVKREKTSLPVWLIDKSGIEDSAIVCYTAVFSVVTQRSSQERYVTTLKTAV